MNVHYSTTNGERTGRASNFFRSIDEAGKIASDQNDKAIAMGISARYALAEVDENEIAQVDKKSIR